jgi:hypothetical protein
MGKSQNSQKDYLIVDPPSGWQYGFPKIVHDEEVYNANPTAWLHNNGYPKNLEVYYIRSWRDKIE